MGTSTVFSPSIRKSTQPCQKLHRANPSQHTTPKPTVFADQQPATSTKNNKANQKHGHGLAVASVRRCPSCFCFKTRSMLTLPVPNDYAKGGTPTARRARGDGRGLGLTGIIAGQGQGSACKGGDRRSSVSRIGTLLRPFAFCFFTQCPCER